MLRPREDGYWRRMAVRLTRATPAYRFCAVWAPGQAEGVAVARFGPTGLDMLFCRCERVVGAYPVAACGRQVSPMQTYAISLSLAGKTN